MRLTSSRNQNSESKPKAGTNQSFQDTIIESTAVLGAPDTDNDEAVPGRGENAAGFIKPRATDLPASGSTSGEKPSKR